MFRFSDMGILWGKDWKKAGVELTILAFLLFVFCLMIVRNLLEFGYNMKNKEHIRRKLQ